MKNLPGKIGYHSQTQRENIKKYCYYKTIKTHNTCIEKRHLILEHINNSFLSKSDIGNKIMTSVAALPSNIPYNGLIITLVVPAENGCNLLCPYCFIGQRGEERGTQLLKPKHYRQFIEQLTEKNSVAAVCIQGYEPLLPDAVPYTVEIIEAGNERRIPTSLVTNGVCLSESSALLANLKPSKITVSIDSASARRHDKLRGKVGAWRDTIKGLRKFKEMAPDQIEINVASILFPNRRDLLDDMPSMLSDIGIENWHVTLFLNFDVNGVVKTKEEKWPSIQSDLIYLQELSEKYSIELTLDDELNSIGLNSWDFDDVSPIRLRRLSDAAKVVRLQSNGQCSFGGEILETMREAAPRWIPSQMSSSEFLRSVGFI